MIFIDKSDICQLHAELLDAYVQLDDAERRMIDADTVVVNLTNAVESIKSLGNTPEVRDFYKIDTILESLTHRDPNTLTAASAMEGVGNAIGEAIKKFVAYVKELIAKISLFFQRLFNVVDKKGKEVLTAIRFLNYDKKVTILPQDKTTKIFVCGAMLHKHLMSRINVTGNMLQYIKGMDGVLKQFAMQSGGVLVSDGNGLSIADGATDFESLTLKEGKWDANNIRTAVTMYTDRQNSVGPIRAGFNKLANTLSMMDYAAPAAAMGAFNDVKLAFKTDSFAYSMIGKLQGILARNILGFYKCIDRDGEVVYEPEVDDGTHALPNKAA